MQKLEEQNITHMYAPKIDANGEEGKIELPSISIFMKE
jgi:hypothetical protein